MSRVSELALEIRSWLVKRGGGSPSQFWRESGMKYSYNYVNQMFYYLAKLGLIKRVRPRISRNQPSIYVAVESRLGDACWYNPERCVKPDRYSRY